jgi:hypothetical protein
VVLEAAFLEGGVFSRVDSSVDELMRSKTFDEDAKLAA